MTYWSALPPTQNVVPVDVLLKLNAFASILFESNTLNKQSYKRCTQYQVISF
jgi:hypothetical protein